jgi:hypothetical protein
MHARFLGQSFNSHTWQLWRFLRHTHIHPYIKYEIAYYEALRDDTSLQRKLLIVGKEIKKALLNQ